MTEKSRYNKGKTGIHRSSVVVLDIGSRDVANKRLETGIGTQQNCVFDIISKTIACMDDLWPTTADGEKGGV